MSYITDFKSTYDVSLSGLLEGAAALGRRIYAGIVASQERRAARFIAQYRRDRFVW